ERHPGAHMHVTAEFAIRRLGPEWKQKVGEAPITMTGTGRAVARILRAPVSICYIVLRGANGDGLAERLPLRHVGRIDVARVQEAEMRSVDIALERLQVIAVALYKAYADLVVGDVKNFERRQPRFGA